MTIDSTVYHEAGHCVMACLLKQRFKYVTIDAKDLDADTTGYIAMIKPHIKNWETIEKCIMIGLAGPIVNFYQDYHQAYNMFETMFGTQTPDMMTCLEILKPYIKNIDLRIKYMGYLYECSVSILQHPLNKAYIANVTKALKKEKRLTYSQVRTIMAATRIEMDKKYSVKRW